MKRVLCLSLACLSLASARAATVQNDTVRVDAENGVVRLSVRDAGRWRTVLESVTLPGDGPMLDATATETYDGGYSDPSYLSLMRRVNDERVYSHFKVEPGRVHVMCSAQFPLPGDVEGFLANWRFVPDGKPGKPDATWTPNLRPNPDELIGMHAFRSPAVVVQQGALSAVLLPDLNALGQNWKTLPATLNLDVTDPAGPRLTYGLQPHQVVRHVYWRHEPGETKRISSVDAVYQGFGPLQFSYDILLNANTPPREAYRQAARWWWQTQGTKNLRKDTLPQAVPWKRYVEVGYDEYFPVIYRETELNGQKVGSASQNSWGFANASWFQCWFNDLRSAYGQYLWGKWRGREDLVEKARLTRSLLLNSPQRDGLFPVVFDWDRKQWLGSIAGGGPEIYHTASCAWAGYFLLKWDEDLEKHPASIAFARRLGDGFIKLQKPSGEIPSFIDMNTMKSTGRLEGGAETAACGMYLAYLSRMTGEQKYMDAARKAAEYVRREIMPTQKWFDYETFYSCSGKPESFFDKYTGQNPQNNLSIQWASEMFRQLYLAEKQPQDLRDGEAILDYLNLYQQVWAPPYLTFEGFGGYGVQNTDAEWNDARQAQFACTNLDYYALTGKAEYMERAIAATRASFATTWMPEHAYITPRTYQRTPTGHADENYGHGGIDAPAGPTGWDWGTGSALTAAAYIRRSYGDVWVDFDRKKAYGINGVTATLNGDKLFVTTSVQTVAPVLVRGEGKAIPATLLVNGKPRRISAGEWKTGWTVTPGPAYSVRHRAPASLSAGNATIDFEVWPYSAQVSPTLQWWHNRSGAAVDATGSAKTERVDAGHFRAVVPGTELPGVKVLGYNIRIGEPGRFFRPAWRTEVVRFGEEKQIWTDVFMNWPLPSPWEQVVPTQGPVITPVEGGGLRLAVPALRTFDQWTNANDAPRVMRPAPEGEWSYRLMLDLTEMPRGRNAQAGMALQFGGTDILFFGPFRGESLTVERYGANGLATWPLPAGAKTVELRVRTRGETLWFDWRTPGGKWSTPSPVEARAKPRQVGVILKSWEPVNASATFLEATAYTLEP